jgi:hypothetical protein
MCRAWKSQNREYLKNKAKEYRERKKMEKLLEDNVTFYEDVKLSIQKGNKPFQSMPPAQAELWWSMLNEKVTLIYKKQVGGPKVPFKRSR